MNEVERTMWDNTREIEKHYNNLENILKRHNPVSYILATALRLNEGRTDPVKWKRMPPFQAAHSIEACCAYARGHASDPPHKYRLNRVMNAYHEFHDPMMRDALARDNLTHFVLMMHRQQIEVQHSHSRDDFARILTLFVTSDLRRSSAAFKEKHHLTPHQWLKLCYLFATASDCSSDLWFFLNRVREYLTESKLDDINEDALQSFLSLSCRTPKEIGERFRNEREAIPLYFHSCIRSFVFDTPLIAVGPVESERECFILLF